MCHSITKGFSLIPLPAAAAASAAGVLFRA